MTDENLRWPPVTKDPDDVYPVTLSVFSLCAQFWAQNEQYDIGDFAWPTVVVVDGRFAKGPIGLVMECTTAGRSSAKEPRWGLAADVPLVALDGTVGWTPRVAALQGLNAVSNAAVSAISIVDSTDTADLAVSQIVIDEGTKLLLDYSGGTLGLSYEVEFNFLIAGRQRVGRQVVSIAKK